MSLPKEELKIYEKLSKDFKVVFDVGSRDDLDYYQVNKSCEYHLFEPNTEALASLKKKIALLQNHHIIVNEFGLSDENKDNCVYYKNVQSFIPHWHISSHDSGERFSLRKLDEYAESKNISAIDFLKIDVEGLDYQVILGGLDTIKNKNKVSYIQVENSGSNKQYADLLDNFQFYLTMEPELLKVINTINYTDIDFNRSLVKLDDFTIDFLDTNMAGTGAGANILGVNKNIDFDAVCDERELIFKIVATNKKYGKIGRTYYRMYYWARNIYKHMKK